MVWISFSTAAVNLTVAGMFLGSWLLTRHRSLTAFAACYGLFALAFVLFALMERMPGAAHVGNLLLISGTLLLAQGLAQRAELDIPWRALGTVAFLGCMGTIASFTADSVDLRHASIYASLGAISLILAMASQQAGPRFALERVLVMVLFVCAFVLFTNPRLLASLMPHLVERGFANGTFSAYAIVWIVLSQLLSGTLIALSVRDLVAKARREARIDPLSGLANRRGFDAAVARPGRRGDRPALVMIDIDHFKRVNDQLGHDEGDRAIALLGRVAAAVAPEGACVARLGGEEFAILLADGGTSAAGATARALHEAVRRTPRPLDFTVSIGIAEGPRAGLYKRADEALYRAKNEGRDRTCFHAAEPGTGRAEPGIDGAVQGA